MRFVVVLEMDDRLGVEDIDHAVRETNNLLGEVMPDDRVTVRPLSEIIAC